MKGKKTGGKVKGTQNKVTRDTKEAFQHLVEGNIENMQSWLNSTARIDPAKALDIMIKLAEYFVPKLSRSEATVHIPDNTIHITREIINGSKS